MKIFDQPRYVYETGHPINMVVSNALAEGFDAELLPAAVRLSGLSLCYGILRGTASIMADAEKHRADYLYCDHSYFTQCRSAPQTLDCSGYYRVVLNDRYVHNIGFDAQPERFEQLGVTVKPWRTSGEHILIIPMSRYVASVYGIDEKAWLANVILACKTFAPQRRLIVKSKSDPRPLSELLESAHALICAESNSAIDAVVNGVPVFCSTSAAAAPVANFALNDLDNPAMPDREQWLWNLAYNQFTLAEVKRGYARELLQEASR